MTVFPFCVPNAFIMVFLCLLYECELYILDCAIEFYFKILNMKKMKKFSYKKIIVYLYMFAIKLKIQ